MVERAIKHIERVVEYAAETVAEAVAQVKVEPKTIPRAAPEVELLPIVTQLLTITVILNPATQI